MYTMSATRAKPWENNKRQTIIKQHKYINYKTKTVNLKIRRVRQTANDRVIQLLMMALKQKLVLKHVAVRDGVQTSSLRLDM